MKFGMALADCGITGIVARIAKERLVAKERLSACSVPSDYQYVIHSLSCACSCRRAGVHFAGTCPGGAGYFVGIDLNPEMPLRARWRRPVVVRAPTLDQMSKNLVTRHTAPHKKS